jgi:RimJ/RimL family protein N-acetyltransferase
LLQTERLLLRKPELGDVDAALEYIADPEAMRFIGGFGDGDRAEAQRTVENWIARWDANGFGQFSVLRREDGRWIGRSGLLVWDRAVWLPSTLPEAAEPEIELGWTFVREHWGRGYATEAARAVLTHAWDRLGLDEVLSFTAVGNAPSRAVMTRIGMTHDPADDFDHPRLPEGHPLRRHVLYRVQATR